MSSRKKETITLSISPGTKEKIEEIARRFKIFWGKSPSPSGLIEALARQDLEVGEPFTLDRLQVQSLIESINALINLGKIQEAKCLTELLFERGALENFQCQSLLKQTSQATEIWRKILEEQIQKRQPFLLLYRNSDDLEETFTVRFAEIKFFEGVFYLLAWCEETAGNEEILALIHNRCFRLDRIINLLSINKLWRKNLDFILVQLEFRENSKINIVKSETQDNDEINIVTRKVVNTDWLIQEVWQYRENCLIISPESVRDRFKALVQKIAERYSLVTSIESNE
jgi:predicted DNA-binding transcriptional regulator YafY